MIEYWNKDKDKIFMAIQYQNILYMINNFYKFQHK